MQLQTFAFGCIFACIYSSQVFVLGEKAYNPNKSCGILFSEKDYKGASFVLYDNEQSVDLLEDFRVSSDGWNNTKSIRVSSGCKVETFEEPFFDGKKQKFERSQAQVQLTDRYASAKCSCAKKCKCSDVYMKKSSCARAYIGGSCNECDIPYTDLNKTSKPYFPAEFESSIKAFRLRKGCSLTVYSEEDQDGEETNFEKETVEFAGVIKSYKCTCDDALFKPKKAEALPKSYPVQLNIPMSLDQVIEDLRRHPNHPGLLAARKSMSIHPEKSRSPKNAYILLLGSTGSGKSSAINLLFDNENITKVGDASSTTTDIHEFRIPIPVKDMGMADSELRIIDTPGLSDTRGLAQDAKFLATLDDYLAGHEELSKRIPNVVLIFHKFMDNRFEGQGSTFVKLLRGLDSFRKRITDDTFSNVIFVFSHFCSETKAIQQRPEKKIAQFKKVIEDYSLFPKPILINVAENKAGEQDLPQINGYFRLPNKEFYPRNLYDKMELITRKSGDEVGLAVFQTAFRDSELFENDKRTTVNFKLVSDKNSKVSKYLDIVSAVVFNIKETEISKLLADAYENMNSDIKKKFPTALYYLQKSLTLRNIVNKEDIPKTAGAILELLAALKKNQAVLFLLEKALKIKAPAFLHSSVVAGKGYNVFKDLPLDSSPLKHSALQHSDIGYMIPNILTCNLEQTTKEIFYPLSSKTEYMQLRLKSLGVDGKIPLEKFTTLIKPGYTVKDVSFTNESCTISASREFRLFEFVLNNDVELADEFKTLITNLSPFNESDYENVESWKNFFNEYGTHVVQSVYGGGSIDIELTSSKACFDSADVAAAIFSLTKIAEDVSTIYADKDGNNISSTQTVLTSGDFKHKLIFHGGDQKLHTQDLTQLKIEDASRLILNWRKSLKLTPVLLTTEMKLMPISQLVQKTLGKEEADRIQISTSRLFDSTLKYTTRKNSSPIQGVEHSADPNKQTTVIAPAPRAQIPYLLEITKLAQESNKQMEALTMVIQKLGEDNHKRNQQLEKEKLDFMTHREKLQMEFETKMMDSRNQAEAARNKLQAEMALAQQKLEQENNQRTKEYQNEIRRAQESSDRRMTEMMMIMASRPQPRTSSCLKEGTQILMADWTQKSVETLQIGDIIFDKDMKVTKVLGVAHEFLFNQKFYGFDKTSQFFTDSHIFVGPTERHQDGDDDNFQLHAVSPDTLISLNPLIKYLNVSELSANTKLFHLNTSESNSSVVERQVDLFRDFQTYPKDTKIYFIQVSSPSGTYFANGYVCRHEVPPVQFWPNTMSVLFSLMNNPSYLQAGDIPYTLDTVTVIDNITDVIATRVQSQFRGNMKLVGNETTLDNRIKPIDEIDIDKCVGQIFGNPTLAALGVGIYAKVGQIVSLYLDAQNSGYSPTDIVTMKNVLFQIVGEELQYSLLNLQQL